MKRFWYTEKGRAEFVDEPHPECREDTVLLKTLCSDWKDDV